MCCNRGQYWLTSEHSMRLKAEPYSLFHYWYKRCRMQSRCIFPLSLFAYSQVRGTVTPAFAGYFARIIQRDSSPSAMAPFHRSHRRLWYHLHDCTLNRGSSLELRSSLSPPSRAQAPGRAFHWHRGLSSGIIEKAESKKLEVACSSVPLGISIIRGAHTTLH